ncbi:anti-sigma factor [Polaromonas glacialis]|uniref:anti-sigma factor n=1 Tax=Polaromonas glacialis TaxID=866564 RepID=UPI000497C27C|nr:anti-sigma factor [Polaromonas glacialis]
MSPLDRDELAGEYVLGTLSAARRREVEQRLPGDAELREAVLRWQEQLLPLAALANPVEPSTQLWRRIEASLDEAAAPSPAPVDAAAAPRRPRRLQGSGWWNSVKLWRGLAGTGFAAAAVLASVLVTRLGALPPAAPQYLVVLVAPQDKAPGWVVQASGPKSLSLIPLGQAEVPAEKSLQFWTKGDNWNGPVSLGLVKPGQTIQIPLDKLPPLQPNQLFELTLEPANGSPTNRPTGPIQFIGRAVKVT